MKNIRFSTSIALLLVFHGLMAQNLSFKSLKCNSQVNPLAIDSQQPDFSWLINAEGFNKSQSAFQILIASDIKSLNEKDADLWNSGKVRSSQSTFVKYRGKSLNPNKSYYWTVKVWDETGQASGWSEPARFRMGLKNEKDWKKAEWISLGEDNRISEYRFREYKTGKMKEALMLTSQATGYFRKEIETDKQIDEAFVYVCGLGYYELYVNGEKVGDHVLDPAPSNYDKQAYYVSYDISDKLNSGENALGLILGNGFYGQTISWKRDPESEKDLSYGMPAARLIIKVKYADGSKEDFYSDGSWKSSTGPIVFDNIYGGEIYDSRFEMEAWNNTGFTDTTWSPAKVISPKVSKISAQIIPPIRKLHEFSPQKIFLSSKGNWIVDFGQNIAGWIKISVQEKEGQVITIVPTEVLTVQGDDIYPGSTGGGANGMGQMLKYVCKGEGIETWEPRFTYHGFRYAEITGLSAKPEENSIKAVVVATDMVQTGMFTSSDPLINKMDSVSKWTIINNMHGIPEDCPHREKCGWLGDAHAFCEYALYNYDLLNFYKKYMIDIRTQMREVPGHNNPEEKYMAPTMIAPGKRTSTIAKIDWGVATMYLPWYNWQYYGDSSIVTEFYEDMKILTNYYLSFKGENGIMQNGMGDWCPPRWDRRNNPEAMECPPIVSANAYFYDILKIMEQFAIMNEDHEFEKKMQEEKNHLLQAFNDVYLVSLSGTDYKWYGSQTATIQALQFGMVPKSEIETVVNGLAYDILQNKKGHHSTGIHGNRYIYTILSKYGKEELAYDILTTPEFPSQAYILNNGFTTWPERQFEWDKLKTFTNSLNHPMHSGFAAYFFESLGGIKTDPSKPGYKEFVVNPIYPESISEIKLSIPTPYGNIDNHWETNGDNFSINIKVPFNTKAKLILSKKELKSLKINGLKWKKQQNSLGIKLINGTEIHLGSGNYKIEFYKSN